ncbi:Outer membrane lipoprotein-sorting protein [Fulvivirga imtechensis AK7]|uniref:Outer membrane lipoprotein-sorting protein n=1 Tax=Fulvivirga imtechensis AK7 TaxID=1237149 RepID=L8JUL0_9BACT|nr:outer membrane lipoprotein-sorting protein [Fulvivirga imtechensis]ELR71928.1 Outer membrane lipoprotein-sorting protein [Fulvivirga imtechensis AK7]
MTTIFFILLTNWHQHLALTATEVVQRANDNMRGETSQSELIIRTVRPTWQREMTVKTWMKGEKYAIVLIKSPAKEKGVVFLKREKEVWNWVPALERSIKLPPSMMTQSWMGTDFTNDDLVKESSIVEDYIHSFAGDTTINGRECYTINMVPKPEAAIVWGKLTLNIDKKDFLELHTKFYDEDGELINIMNAYEIKTMGGRLIPTHIEMIPADKPNQKTVLIYSSVTYNEPIPDTFFTLQQMKKLN